MADAAAHLNAFVPERVLNDGPAPARRNPRARSPLDRQMRTRSPSSGRCPAPRAPCSASSARRSLRTR
jgi:hypothetical protein